MNAAAADPGGRPRPKGLVILAVVAVMLLIALWGVLLSEIEGERRQALGEAERNGTNVAKLFEEHVTGLLGLADRLLVDIRNDIEVSPPADMPAYLRRYMLSPAFVLIGVIDADGVLRQSDKSDMEPVDLSDREHFRFQQEHPDDELFIGKPLKGRVSHRWSLHMTRRLSGPHGQFRGAVLISVSARHFVDFIRRIDIGRHGVSTLVGMDHVVRARGGWMETDVAPYGQFFPHAPPFSAPEAAGCYVAPDPIDGEVRLTCWRRLENYPFAVLVSLSEAEILASWRDWRCDALLAGVGFSAMIVVVLVMMGRAWIRKSRAVNDLIDKAAALKVLASTDPLTGLLNRRAFEAAAAVEIERASRHRRSLSVLLLDIDHFKNVNDSFGHPAGDTVLREVAGRCAARLRQADRIGRLGGEEFAVLLPETDASSGRRVAEMLRAIIAATPCRMDDGREVAVTVSVGATELRMAEEESVDQLIVRADRALYHAKDAGRDRVVFLDAPGLGPAGKASVPAPVGGAS